MSGQIAAKRQNIKLKLAVAYPSSSGVAQDFKRGCGAMVSTKFSSAFFFRQNKFKLIEKQGKV